MGYQLQTTLPDKDQPIRHLHKLLKLPEFEFLRDGEARIEFLIRGHDETRGGRRVLGSVHLPTVQGQLKDVFVWMLEDKFGELPDFLIVVESEYWLSANDLEREALVYHELCHCEHATDREGTPRFNAEGQPVWKLRGHDIEQFNAVVRRYGPYNDEIRHFIRAIDDHADRAR